MIVLDPRGDLPTTPMRRQMATPEPGRVDWTIRHHTRGGTATAHHGPHIIAVIHARTTLGLRLRAAAHILTGTR